MAPPTAAPRKLGLSLRLSNAETVEDVHAADIRVEGEEAPTPAFGLKLRLTVASADDDNTPQIATSSNIQSARTHHSAAAPHGEWGAEHNRYTDMRAWSPLACSVTMALPWRASGSSR